MDYCIDYNINKNYLSHWGLNHAFREIMQNFIDYGDYTITDNGNNLIISNDYEPKDMSFMSIGLSIKKKDSAIGKYGEGLKMALMIFTREGYDVVIKSGGFLIKGVFKETLLGETFSVEFTKEKTKGFQFILNTNSQYFNEFYKKNIVKKEDYIFTNPTYGSIINKTAGDVFCGGLFVSNIEGMKKAYDFNPDQLHLDRDRQTPKVFDVNWNASQINSLYGKMKAKDLSYSDNMYVSSIPDETIMEFEPRSIGSEIKFIYKDDSGKEVMLKNESAENVIKRSGFFKEAIKKIKMYLASKLGIYDMLLDFRTKHVHSPDAISDFEIILERFKTENR